MRCSRRAFRVLCQPLASLPQRHTNSRVSLLLEYQVSPIILSTIALRLTPLLSFTTQAKQCQTCIHDQLTLSNSTKVALVSNLVNISNGLLDSYCTNKAMSLYHNLKELLSYGQILAAKFQSPVLFWNMTLLDEPVELVDEVSDELLKPKLTDDQVDGKNWYTLPASKITKDDIETCNGERTYPCKKQESCTDGAFSGSMDCAVSGAIFRNCTSTYANNQTHAWNCLCNSENPFEFKDK